MKKIIDGRFLMGLGAGIIIACILMLPFMKREPSAMEIETRARAMGMVYEDEIRAIPKSNEGGEIN
ncbi:MAG TPA: hypothetical protein GX505_02515 [Clostridiales bacterium]|nr:hypothetical protein [Clostridiales bacterium]